MRINTHLVCSLPRNGTNMVGNYIVVKRGGTEASSQIYKLDLLGINPDVNFRHKY